MLSLKLCAVCWSKIPFFLNTLKACPFVAVVTGSIASCHDVRELYGHTGIGQLWCDHGLCPGFLLEWDDVVVESFLLGVVSHVEQSEAHLSQTSVGSHEVAALHDALYQVVGQRLACLIVEGEGAKEVFLHSIVLHELRRQLHKVPPYIGSRQTLKSGVGKHAVQAVSELMQEGFHLAKCQQGWLLSCRFGEVHHHADMRTYVLPLMV